MNGDKAGVARLWQVERDGNPLRRYGHASPFIGKLGPLQPQALHRIARITLSALPPLPDPTLVIGMTESSLLLSYAGGARALLAQSLVADLPGTAEVVGSRGWARLGPEFHAATELVVQTDAGRSVDALDDARTGYAGELEEVARCRAAGLRESPRMPLAASLTDKRVLDEARRAITA